MPALRLGSGRWQARHLAGQFAAGETLVAKPTALPVCEVAARPHLPRRLPAPPSRSLKLLTAGREPVQIRTSDLGQPIVGTLWRISARYLGAQFPAGVRIALCNSRVASENDGHCISYFQFSYIRPVRVSDVVKQSPARVSCQSFTRRVCPLSGPHSRRLDTKPVESALPRRSHGTIIVGSRGRQ